jgi:hypothetical protein
LSHSPGQTRASATHRSDSIFENEYNLTKADHRLKPGGIHTGKKNWNAEWKRCIDEHGDATKDEILEHLEEMKKDFGI